MQELSDYELYRGKCKQLSEEAIVNDPSLTLVRGYYHCPIWGMQQHWWTVRQDGTIYDPSVRQFPTKGVGAEYEEFDGYVTCEECGTVVSEEAAQFYGRYVYCSTHCICRSVGV